MTASAQSLRGHKSDLGLILQDEQMSNELLQQPCVMNNQMSSIEVVGPGILRFFGIKYNRKMCTEDSGRGCYSILKLDMYISRH